MRRRILFVMLAIALTSSTGVPAHAEYPDERIFTVAHQTPAEAYSEVDLNLTVTVQSNCDDFTGFLSSYNCAQVQLTVYYETPLGIATSKSVYGNRGTDQQVIVAVIPKEDVELGLFSYYLEVSQTYCIFFGCMKTESHHDFGRVRIPETGAQNIPVDGAFPTEASDNLSGIDIDGSLMKINFQECGPRNGGGTCTTVDSRPVKYFSGDSRGAIYYPCQGAMARLDGSNSSGRCVFAGTAVGSGYADATAKTRTTTGPSCNSWSLRAGDLIDADMTANFIHMAPDSNAQFVFNVSEFFLNVTRSSNAADTWQIRNQATDPNYPDRWSYFIGVDSRNSQRYLKMYLSGSASSSSPTAVCSNGDHIAELVLDIAGVGLIFTEGS